MYRVLIADDEPSVMESLQESIDWEELGLRLEACVSNGKQVPEIVEKQCIDIAILDIRMPGMNGLEVCEYLRKKREDIQLIIVSGYAEFSYAERAIRYGVLGYCLKPLEYDQVIKLLVKAIKNLEKAERAEKTVTDANLLEALENGGKELEKLLGLLGYREEKYYVAVTIGEDKIALPAGEGIVLELSRRQRGYIFKHALSEEVTCCYLEQQANRGIGYTKEPVKVKDISAALDECSIEAYQFFVEPGRNPGKKVDEQKANECLGQILQNVEKDRWDVVCEQLIHIGDRKREYFNVRFCVKLCNIIYTGSLFREEENDYYIYSIGQLVSEYGSMSGMLCRLQEEIAGARQADCPRDSFSNTAFMKLMGYIGEHYKSDISLSSAGAALHMNPNYVSQLFKKEAGITFVHYITQLRMEDAINLLTTTKTPVVEIAMQVGFNDYFYFLKTFKKFTGKTPSQYRDEN